ncbi:T. brucei spp.-specific protein [Trypanosoma brucei gambiense DAL972]|uniref:T. brucei spp.-specific protein n=1 Tax=Trypanosoma brucei gambiense (strain MHOM/CI/86/DAL972) TaxID=679716 RepID=D0A3J9_TRYB9|nr:T. brucei spp.-specific protein [Trypanosoma brucei gambiense DAL972]CBH15843.1 T. brucei spp.-specific protein [Trypanosoma brucei gambiense DAL972]|eukprot:XP_011778107.1 T. brucei spp.-specific protein [Trypanosoma brucei gambiense DAL972]
MHPGTKRLVKYTDTPRPERVQTLMRRIYHLLSRGGGSKHCRLVVSNITHSLTCTYDHQRKLSLRLPTTPTCLSSSSFLTLGCLGNSTRRIPELASTFRIRQGYPNSITRL